MYSFIILNYFNIEDTITCLKYLKELKDNDKAHYIIVDNNSLTDSELRELKKYTGDIVKLDKNYGFAVANNKGIEYAKNKYSSNYYIVINNDVFISQKDFLNIINSDYTKYNFDMLGPKIDSPTGESVNPFPAFKTKEEINKEIIKCNKLIKIYSNPIFYIGLEIYLKTKYIFKKRRKPVNGEKLEFNVPLHGCAIIFSKKYLDKYKHPFNNETFLFHEEEFLYNRVIKEKLISVYDPNLSVFHREGSSIKKKNKKSRLNKLFKEKERLKSLKLLQKYI